MATGSIFTEAIRGDRPARFVWSDEKTVALLADAPLAPGHTVVVPRVEVDYWIDLEPEALNDLMQVAREVARAIQVAFRPPKVGMVVAGIEVRHVHLHLSPIGSVADLDFRRKNPNPRPEEMDQAAEEIRAALRGLGHRDVVPGAGPLP